MQPTASIQLGGASFFTVTNNGVEHESVMLAYGSDPTDGSDTWGFADSPSNSDCG